MSIHLEINKINELNSLGPNGLVSYQIPEQINVPSLLESLLTSISNAPINGTNKNYKMEHYYPVLEFIVREVNKIYFAQVPDNVLMNRCDQILSHSLLEKLTLLAKGQVLLNKLAHRIGKVTTQQKTIMSLLMDSARTGPFMTFLFWLSRYQEKSVEKLPRSELEQIITYSIGNSDDRLFKFVLEKVIKADKLFFQKNTSTINNMISSLSNSLVPAKYQLKRLKILSGYISLVPYFYQMINHFSSEKVLVELHKYYYVNPHNFDSIQNLMRILVENDWTDEGNMSNTINHETFDKIVPLLKTEEELYIINILLGLQYGIHQIDKFKKQLVDKIVKENFSKIIESLHWENIAKSNDLAKYICSSLCDQNLINKYLETHSIRHANNHMLLYTRFLPVPPISNKSSWQNDGPVKAIKINKLLHHLRMYVKSKCKTRVIQHKVKMFDLLREISTFSPKKSIPVLSHGSAQYKFQKQKFTNLPPRHLLPGEICVYKNFLLKEKADGVLIANMPIGIYPQTQLLNNHQVKAEYIEDLDLYLVFDIDIPNTTIEERYDILRKAHPYTSGTQMESISSLDDFIEIFKKERTCIEKFIKESQSEPIKWYPKFACVYNSNDLNIHSELIDNIILEKNLEIKETISASTPFACDGLILTPLDGSREIKIKPKSMMTIDLAFDGKKWLDRNGHDWSGIIIKPKTAKKEGRIYRCYPDESFDKFTVGEFRFDKKKPNPYNIVDNIVTMGKYDWNRDTNLSNTYYYDTSKKITSGSLIQTINTQVENLSSELALMEPEINKTWLDLGCGRGKLIPLIKKYNPKSYLGLDADVNQLIRGIQYHDENQDVYVFSPCDLAGDWTNTPIQWHQINPNIKYDYVVANFSLMHFCTEKFWSQLDKITHTGTKFMFNVVCPPNNNDSWSDSNSYLRIEGNQTIYKFEWTHNEEKTEPFIPEQELTDIIKRNNWQVIEKKHMASKHKLINFYKWWIITKC